MNRQGRPTAPQAHGVADPAAGMADEAAKAQGVKRVWYVSLAFGGFGDGSKIGFQQSHYRTEDLLVQ